MEKESSDVEMQFLQPAGRNLTQSIKYLAKTRLDHQAIADAILPYELRNERTKAKSPSNGVPERSKKPTDIVSLAAGKSTDIASHAAGKSTDIASLAAGKPTDIASHTAGESTDIASVSGRDTSRARAIPLRTSAGEPSHCSCSLGGCSERVGTGASQKPDLGHRIAFIVLVLVTLVLSTFSLILFAPIPVDETEATHHWAQRDLRPFWE